MITLRGVEPNFREGRELVGVTATPRRTDKVSLDECYDELTFSSSIVELIPDYLVDFRAVTVQSGVDLSEVDTYRGELSEGQVGDAMISADYMREFPRVIERACRRSEAHLGVSSQCGDDAGGESSLADGGVIIRLRHGARPLVRSVRRFCGISHRARFGYCAIV